MDYKHRLIIHETSETFESNKLGCLLNIVRNYVLDGHDVRKTLLYVNGEEVRTVEYINSYFTLLRMIKIASTEFKIDKRELIFLAEQYRRLYNV